MQADVCPATGKVIHKSSALAQQHLHRLVLGHGYKGLAYRCPICTGWHVGSTPKQKRKR
jgi:hypothetical protein